MSINSVYKKLTPSDQSYVPFNAQKQYTFTNSASAAENSINFFYTSYTSESFALYSTASSVYGTDAGTMPNSARLDVKNVLKYNQIDHLFYRQYILGAIKGGGIKPSLGGKNIDVNRFGTEYDFLKHKRILYNKAGIISMPSGYYGHAVKKGSFSISGSRPLIKDGPGSTLVDDSYGNLIVSGTIIEDYVTDHRKNILNIGPQKGFRKYDLGVYDYYVMIDGFAPMNLQADGTSPGNFYRRGTRIPNPPTLYNTGPIVDNFDDSYFFNVINYTNVTFSEDILFNPNNLNLTTKEYADKFSVVNFHGGPLSATEGIDTTSYIKIPNDSKYHFNKGDDFTISFWMKYCGNETLHSNEKAYLIEKSTTKTVPAPITTTNSEPVNTDITGALQLIDIPAEPQFPFAVYLALGGAHNRPHVYFERSDGLSASLCSASVPINITGGTIPGGYEAAGAISTKMQHIACRVSSSEMSIFVNGIKSNPTDGTGTFLTDGSTSITQNNANIYVGVKGQPQTDTIYQSATLNESLNHFSGSMSQINIFSNDLSDKQILNHYSSSNNSPYVGNLFYSHGLAVITHPGYLSGSELHSTSSFVDLAKLQFEGNHLIYEHEFQCSADEYEFNDTMNLTARKIQSPESMEKADFATGSIFKPYVTTIGLYNEERELLVVGKLAQPIRMSDETDTTFIIRYDT